MSKFLKAACYLTVSLLFMQSCVNNDYDTDELNKDAVFKIPPVPLGNIEKFNVDSWFDYEESVIPPDLDLSWLDGIQLDLDTISYSETVEDLFTEDIIDQFFFVGAEEDVVLKSDVDISLLRGGAAENPNVRITVAVNVTDVNGNIVREIHIPSINQLTSKDNQKVEIRVPKADFEYMKNASGLNFTFFIKTTVSNISHITEAGNYIQLKNVLLTSAGLKFEF